jgi:hypothetical protein
MRTSSNKTMIAVVTALAMGVAMAGSVGSAFAGQAAASLNPNFQGAFGQTNSFDNHNSGQSGLNQSGPGLGGAGNSNASTAVGSIDAYAPTVPAGQVQYNCHLFTHHGAQDCSGNWTPGQSVD